MAISNFPSTRYQGSKRKLGRWIADTIADLQFDSALDLFGGTGSVGYLFKTMGKQVIYNDLLPFNHMIGLALIENAAVRLSDDNITLVITPQPDIDYPDFIARSFSGIYFTDAENAWLDRAVYHIDYLLTDPYKQALARFALYQACLAKRPYNLFHRANLYMREAEVSRSFGNKATWDRPFEDHFRRYAHEANAAVFDNGRANRAICGDALDAPQTVDLVYIDPPYISANGIGVDYHGFYHFLDGLTAYQDWPARIDYHTKHRALQPQDSPWTDPDRIFKAFEAVIKRFQHSILVISYRDNGIPAKDELIRLLRGYKSEVREAQRPQQYALSTRQSHELLLIAQ